MIPGSHTHSRSRLDLTLLNLQVGHTGGLRGLTGARPAPEPPHLLWAPQDHLLPLARSCTATGRRIFAGSVGTLNEAFYSALMTNIVFIMKMLRVIILSLKSHFLLQNLNARLWFIIFSFVISYLLCKVCLNWVSIEATVFPCYMLMAVLFVHEASEHQNWSPSCSSAERWWREPAETFSSALRVLHVVWHLSCTEPSSVPERQPCLSDRTLCDTQFTVFCVRSVRGELFLLSSLWETMRV